MKAAVLSVKCLENESVECMFVDPGDKNVDILDANLESPIRFIITRREQDATFMFDVFVRLAGKAVVTRARSRITMD
jgi:thiamine pyrophosphate-dependent acetolactate synthase large subunit-like protein